MIQRQTPFSELLKSARETAGVSRGTLAARAGLDVSHLYRIEVGDRRPSRESALALADALGVQGAARDVWLAAAGYAPMPLTGAVRGAIRTRGSARRPAAAPSAPDEAARKQLAAVGLEEERFVRILRALDGSTGSEASDVGARIAEALSRLALALEAPVKSAVIPAAGGQHRMLASHVMQRLLLRVIREASDAGISRIVLVLAPGAGDALYAPLKEALDLAIVPGIELLHRVQRQPIGLGDAILEAEPDVSGAPFAVLLPDDVLVERRTGGPRGIPQVWRQRRLEDAHLLAVFSATRSRMLRGGVAVLGGAEVAPRVFSVRQLVERPYPDHAVLRSARAFAIVGRYVLQPTVFEALRALRARNATRVELTDALDARREAGDRVCAVEVDAPRPDLDSLFGAWTTS